MFWVSGNDTIYVANLDGTAAKVFLQIVGSRFDGMVLDVRRDRCSASPLFVIITKLTRNSFSCNMSSNNQWRNSIAVATLRERCNVA